MEITYHSECVRMSVFNDSLVSGVVVSNTFFPYDAQVQLLLFCRFHHSLARVYLSLSLPPHVCISFGCKIQEIKC